MPVINIAQLDPKDFNIRPIPEGFLVVASKVKHAWGDDELHLRSLIVSPQGEVLSTGFPKFFNLGERPWVDKLFAEAFSCGAVEFTEKIDGSLLIADRIHGVPHWRTRGLDTLGDFVDHVLPTVESHSHLTTLLETADWLDDYSLLFEYTGPDNVVILKYPERSIRLLALMHKPSLRILWDGPVFDRVKSEAHLETPLVHNLKGTLKEVQQLVLDWKNKEGVVGRFHGPNGEPMLIKLKSMDYLMRHAVLNRLTPRRIRQMVIMLDVKATDDLVPFFHELGLDYEVVETLRPGVEAFLLDIRALRTQFDAAVLIAAQLRAASASKASYVQAVRSWQQSSLQYTDASWFPRMMLLYDGKTEQAWIAALATLTQEPQPTVKSWYGAGKKGFTNMLIKEESEGPLSLSR